MEELTQEQFINRYCSKSDSMTSKTLKEILDRQEKSLKPDGWMLLEAQLLDSSWAGSLVILPYGENCTYKEIPNHPISPRGLASDTSVVIAITKSN